MPNHIKNRLTINGTPEQVKAVVELFSTHHPSVIRRAYDGSIICRKTGSTEFTVGWLDEKTNIFKRREEADVIGLPEGWEYEYTAAYDAMPDFNKVIPQPENIFNGDLGREDEERCRREGIPTWYDWNRANWGTKWGGYDYEKVSENVFSFETAWNAVPKIIEAISKTFPDIVFGYDYADEDTGSSNCGMTTIQNGDWLSIIQPESGSREAYEICFALDHADPKYYKLVGDTYEYYEEDEEEEDEHADMDN